MANKHVERESASKEVFRSLVRGTMEAGLEPESLRQAMRDNSDLVTEMIADTEALRKIRRIGGQTE